MENAQNNSVKSKKSGFSSSSATFFVLFFDLISHFSNFLNVFRSDFGFSNRFLDFSDFGGDYKFFDPGGATCLTVLRRVGNPENPGNFVEKSGNFEKVLGATSA